MGNEQSAERDMSQYHHHQRIGIYRYVTENGENFIELQKQLIGQKIYKEWLNRIRQVKLSMVGSDVVYLPLRHHFQRTQVCGSGGINTLIFQEWENFLKEEITNRRKNQNWYTEEQLWFIFYSLIRVGVLYEGHNTKIGDLHPSNIIVTPQGFIKVITKDSLPLEQTNFQKIVEEVKSDVYLAPEQMQVQMLQSGVYTVSDPSKADVFSLGITMLETITLQNCSYLYIRNPLRISFDKMTALTNIMKDKYSDLLYRTVLSTLAINPHQRKSFLQLYELLRPHEQKIIDFQPFSLAGSTVRADRSFQDITIHSSPREVMAVPRGRSNVPFSPPSQQYLSNVKRQ